MLLAKGSFHFLLPGVADERNVSKDNREKEREGRKGQMGGCTVVHLHPKALECKSVLECKTSVHQQCKGSTRREV